MAELSGIKNILLLVSDQQRRDCLGPYGNSVVETPTLDELARKGVRFDNMFTPISICTPARACLQTGLLPQHTDMIFNWEFQRCRGGVKDLPDSTPFFSRDLKALGWNLSHNGKWHIGDESRPADTGYDGQFHPGYGFPDKHPHYVDYLKNLGLTGFNLDNLIDHPMGANRHNYGGEQEGGREASIPAYLAEETIGSIRKFAREDKPFFTSAQFWGPHSPFRIPAEYLNMYMDRLDEIEPWLNCEADLSQKPEIIRIQGEGIFQANWMDTKARKEMIARYYGYVTLIDHEMGRIIQALKDEGVYDETLIMYTTDHGSALGSYGMWDKGFGMYDCFFRIPMIISHSEFAPGISDATVDLCDLAPTFREIAGCEPDPELDGFSLLPLLRREKDALREDFYCASHWGHQFPFWQRMIRTKRVKYIWNVTDRDEFYDLENDPWEMTNLIDQVDKEELQDLQYKLYCWLRDNNDVSKNYAIKLMGIIDYAEARET
ncbi:MAG: sulfatase-like hydrolase/transferase [Spirochaetales bacterium]|nr:sulfatase-like hydrolase/transferase [Spirochaetales bacterium]